MYHPRHTLPVLPVHSRSFSVILSCPRYFPSPCYHVPYLSVTLSYFHFRLLSPYFLGPSPSFSDLPATFPPVPDPFRVSFSYPHPFRFLPLSSDLFRHPSLPRFPSISVYIFVSTRFLSIFHIRIRP